MSGAVEALAIIMSIASAGYKMVGEALRLYHDHQAGKIMDLDMLRSRRARILADIMADEAREIAAFKSHTADDATE